MVVVRETIFSSTNTPAEIYDFQEERLRYPYSFSTDLNLETRQSSTGIYLTYRKTQLCVLSYELDSQGYPVLRGQSVAKNRRDVVKNFLYAQNGCLLVEYSLLEFNDKNKRVKSALTKLGLLEEKELPEQINFDETVELFMEQAIKEVGTHPILISKE